MEREDFLARLRTSLAGGGAPPPRPEPRRPAASKDEMAERFVRELAAVGGVVHRAASSGEARLAILDILAARGARRVIRGATQKLRELDLDRSLERAGVELTVADLEDGTPREALREANFTADAGITSADYGVAETGTLALVTRPGQGRAVSLLPPVHVAVLDADDVVAELGALFERVTADGAELPSALTFITGPSRTGDIELVLTVGVHGPKELHVVLLR